MEAGHQPGHEKIAEFSARRLVPPPPARARSRLAWTDNRLRDLDAPVAESASARLGASSTDDERGAGLMDPRQPPRTRAC